MIHDFNKSIKTGEAGEKIVVNYLKANPNTFIIKEVQDEKLYRDRDIDLVVSMKNGREYTVEIKTDTYNSGNIFYETMSAVETNSIGCMEKTEADFLFYYFTVTRELYIIDMPSYRKWFWSNINRFNLKKFKNLRWNGSHYTSEGYTVPKKFLEGNFKKYKKVILGESLPS